MDRFEALRQNYARSLPQKADELALAWQSCLDGSDAAGAALHQAVHRLAGSAPAYGFPALGERAQQADALLLAWLEAPPARRPAPADLHAALAPHIAALLDALRAPP